MRYTNEITFLKITGDEYDPEIGENVITYEETGKTLANVTDLGTSRQSTIFGQVEEGIIVVRTQPFYKIPEYNRIKVDDKYWSVITIKGVSRANTLMLKECKNAYI